MGVRLLGASHGQLLRLVVLPSCVPWFLTSLRTGLGMAFSGAIVGEYLGASRGLGWAITNAGERYDVARVLACVLVILCLVMLLGTILHLFERRLLRWRTVRGDGLGT